MSKKSIIIKTAKIATPIALVCFTGAITFRIVKEYKRQLKQLEEDANKLAADKEQEIKETKEKLANASRGRYPSLETRKKISESNRKRIITESFKEKMRKPRKPMSEETKRKISLTRHIKYGNKINLKQVG